MSDEKNDQQPLSDQLAAINAKLNELVQRLPTIAKPQGGRTAVVWVSLVLGAICILSAILKSWLGEPKAIDWGLALLGVVLAGFSLFKSFEVSGKGITAVMALLNNLRQQLQNISDMLGR